MSLDDTVRDLPGGAAPAAGDSPAVSAPDHPRYRFDRILGRGASAQVFDARDLVFDRPVAVKVLGDLGGGSIARFLREARITALLDHPNVITVYDLDFDERGRSILVMRRVEGLSLGEALHQREAGTQVPGLATINDLLEIVIKVCDALSRAHARGVCHQDVKPDNILLGSDGEVMLVDWGEASISGDDSEVRPGTPVGTPMYMSPEQARGGPTGPASDIYGLGAVLFHAVVGRPPLRAAEFARFMERRSRGELDPPEARERERVPPPLLSIIFKALAPEPAQRYQTVLDLRADLRNFQGGLAVTAFREGWSSRALRWIRRRRKELSAGAVMLGMVGVILWLVVGERLKERAVWGGAAITERFQGAWSKDWSERVPGTFTVRDGWVVSGAANDAYLTCSRILTPPVAVEYQARMLPGNVPCDLSLVWSSVASTQATDPARDPGFVVKYGAFQNANLVISRMPDGARLVQRPVALDVDRVYRMRVEIEEDRITAFLDGQQVMTYRDFLPVGPGRVSLLAWYPGKAFSDVRIYRKDVPEKISILSLGDSSMRHGDFTRAAEEYGLILASPVPPPVIEQARYRLGLALWSLDRHAEAARAWALLEDPALIRQTSSLRLAWQGDQGPAEGFDTAFRTLWRAAPDLRTELLQTWERTARRAAIVEDRLAGEFIGQLLPLRSELFADDAQTSFGDTALRTRLGSDPRHHAPSLADPQTRTYSMIATGKVSAVYERERIRDWERAKCCWHTGRLTEILAITGVSDLTRQMVLLKLDRREDAATKGSRVNWLLASGRAEEALALADRGQPEYQATLLQLGRWDQAAKEPIGKGDMATWSRGIARILNGCEEEDPFFGANFGVRDQARWLRARMDGKPPKEGDQERLQNGIVFADVHFSRVFCDQGWFIPWFAAPFLEALGRNPRDMTRDLETVSRDHGDQFALRPRYLADFLRGAIDREAFLRQPVASEAEAWLHVGEGMRAELRGDASGAIAAYRAFLGLPRHRRLLIGVFPDPLVERFVPWRLAVLEARP